MHANQRGEMYFLLCVLTAVRVFPSGLAGVWPGNGKDRTHGGDVVT